MDQYRNASAAEAVDGLRIAKTKHGLGLFATRRFKKGAFIGRVLGQVIDDPDYSTSYCMDLGGSLSLEPAAPFRYLNHCCTPNCVITYYETDDGDEPQLWIEAIAPILAGDELTIDYCWPADGAIPCECGSSECRGWIVDPAELQTVLDTRKPKKQSGRKKGFVS